MEKTDEIIKSVKINDKFLSSKKHNCKLYPIYKMFSWDLLFYYPIIFLFLTQSKGFSASDVLIADAFYRIFKLISQIPCVNIAEKIGLRKSIIVGNILVSISIFGLLISNSIKHVIISNAIMAFGYSLKDLCDCGLLRNSITAKEHPGTAFTNLDGKGSAYYYYFEAVTSISCGFLFVFNNYLPMILCLLMCLISCLLAYNFKPYEEQNRKQKLEETGNYITYIKDLRTAFRNIFGSSRLKALFVFSGMFAALLALRSTIASSLFTEIGIKEEYFGIIFAVLTCFSAIASKNQNFFHKTLKNKVLTYFSLTFSGSCIVIGLVSLFSHNFTFTIIVILTLYAIQYIIKGPYYTLLKRYLNSFSSSSMSTKIYSVNTLIESLFSGIMCYLASLLLEFTSTKCAIAMLGCVFFIVFILVLDYMKDKIGLKPDEYKKSDINFTEVH